MKSDISNKIKQNAENAVSRIQISLQKLQTAINTNKNITNRNERQNILNLKNDDIIKSDNAIKSETIINQQTPIGYSMFNTNSVLRTDKRYNKNSNQDDLIKTDISKNSSNITDKPITNYNTNKKWICLNCGNMNLFFNNFCINCGKIRNSDNKNIITSFSNKNNTVNKNSSYEKNNTEINTNISNIISKTYKSDNSSKPSGQDNNFNYNNKDDIKLYKYNENSFINDKIKTFSSWMSSQRSSINEQKNNKSNNYLNNLNEYNLNYKKINDLYSYGDYLENELKQSNDENVILLEKFDFLKNDVHNLNQQNNKIKQNIEELQKKENELNKLNSQLRDGFPLVQQRFEKFLNYNENNLENINILKELDLKNSQNIAKQKNYDIEIENLKQKINILLKQEEDNINKEKNNQNLDDILEKEKNEILENNKKYILLLKDNDSLNSEIKNLEKKLSLAKSDDELENENLGEDYMNRLNLLKKDMLKYNKEINENKIITNNLLTEYKSITNNLNSGNNLESRKEYLLLKEKNNKLSSELLKLNSIIENLSQNKNKIIDIYEDEKSKLNNFYLKAKEKVIINYENKEKDIEEIMNTKEKNEELKKENFELIKDLDELPELKKVYQVLVEENKKMKMILNENELDKKNQKYLKDIIDEENYIEEKK